MKRRETSWTRKKRDSNLSYTNMSFEGVDDTKIYGLLILMSILYSIMIIFSYTNGVKKNLRFIETELYL